jgi:hypothetical protein
MARQSKEEKRAAMAQANRDQAEPQINMLTYSEDILKYMNYHNVASDDKQRRKWTVEGLKYIEREDAIEWLDKATDFELKQLGPLLRACFRD